MTIFTKKDGKRTVGDIKMYALSTCGWCKKTKEFLNSHDIAYSYVDVDMVPENEIEDVVAEQRGYNPSGSFPTIVVNGEKVIIGFDQEELEKLAGK
ncbi:glutaredoxin family protein [Christensenellaceae bacterium OttesenSCG-928-K19]|nr:glutaredoxin family protein [Christensenellaceae bacterium OttesenSCG-928-K19]